MLTNEHTIKMVSLLVAFTLILPSCGFHPFESVGHRQRPNVKLSMGMPKLIVFDLDNTLWTPELYQLRKRHGKENFSPTPRKDVNLMKGAEIVLEKLVPQLQEQGVQFAIASRTKSVEWAHALLGQFGIKHIMNYVEIMPGNKRNHFLNIKVS